MSSLTEATLPGPIVWAIIYAVVYVAVFVRALSVDGREPASRAAWVLVLVFLPGLGMLAYLLLGEPWIGRRVRLQIRAMRKRSHGRARAPLPSALDTIPERFRPAFRTGERLAGSPVVGENETRVSTDSDAVIEMMVRDMDAARETIHLCFYIWLVDINGLKVVDALVRAARRGVTCRVIADGVGSRLLIRSRYWEEMRDAGVRLCISLKVARGLGVVLGSRADLRNHRKIVVVDDRITYCGSQNCADPEFRVKPRFAPWVDIMLRMEGPVALQNQLLFERNWGAEMGEELPALPVGAPPPSASGAEAGVGVGVGVKVGATPTLSRQAERSMGGDVISTGVAFGTGPMSPRGAMADVFAGLMYCAEEEVVITTPYFVPDPVLLAALIGCARRGVRTVLILPARNDSWVVGLISRAQYTQLVNAGVEIFEYRGGLLHAKTMVVDGAVALVGSANMDRRSLDLNFENNVLLYSPDLAARIRRQQDEWMDSSRHVTRESVSNVPLLRRLAGNLATIFGPIM